MSKIKKIVCVFDAHLEAGEEFDNSYKLLKKYIKSVKPDIVLIGGDFLDCSSLSTYNIDSPLLTENKRLSNDIKMAKKELSFFEKYSKQVIYLAGNHERRLNKIVEKYPVFTDNILTWSKLLDIDYYIELEDQPIQVIPELYIMHGHKYGTHLASQNVRDYMENIICGHAHRSQTYTLTTMKKSVTGWSSGCLSSREPKYLAGRKTTWVNGFIEILYDDEGFNVNNIIIENDRFIIDGKKWC